MARVLAGLAALLSALCIASAAWAHATLLSSEPADGSVLTAPPKMVQLHFNEGVAPAVIGVIDAAGKTRDVATRAVGQSVLIVCPMTCRTARKSSATAWSRRTVTPW